MMQEGGARRPQEELDLEMMRFSVYDTPYQSGSIQMTPGSNNYYFNFTPQYTPHHSNLKYLF